MFHFTLFPEKNKEFFFQKKPLFLAHFAHSGAKQNVPLNSEEKVMLGFQATLVSDAHMPT